MKLIVCVLQLFTRMNVTTNEEHLHFINFMKLIEESNMSEVLGSFSADPAALFTVNQNLVTNELTLTS